MADTMDIRFEDGLNRKIKLPLLQQQRFEAMLLTTDSAKQ
jgi:hypothetical protein